VDACRSVLTVFTGLPHRVALVRQAGGVAYYDDSKATTPASVLAAVAGFASVVLIAGGRNKGLDLSVLQAAVPPVKAVVAIGEASGEVATAFAGRVPLTEAFSMDEAVATAAAMADPGDAVLLSPGCASFDWYGSYAERGDDFARAVDVLVGSR
jgi:UDP-N-acetylmuramoylalanine--D-glutamate ligase